MDKKERTIKFKEITEKHSIESSEDFEKEEHIFKIINTFTISNLMICALFAIIGMIFSLDWLMFIVLVISIISFVVLIISLIRSHIHGNKTKKKWNKYLEEIHKMGY